MTRSGLTTYLDTMEKLEEQIAHLTRTVEELSDVIARQDGEIALLTRRVQMLLEREASRESDGGGGVVMGDERPPHY
ncbi:SlyX protein [Shimia isoporae]|uniref:SlyX protein n=2 Tax=Shimia isoporae TaxID=647720 RepID=A0A4R1N9A4_9RHOB|nr:SlyX protein [Shimia isoporae]